MRSRRQARKVPQHLAIVYALYQGGDRAVAEQAARELERAVATGPVSTTDEESRALDLCALEQWRINAGNLRSAPATIHWLRTRSPMLLPAYVIGNTPPDYCALLLDAMLAFRQNAPDVDSRMQRLDSALVESRGGFTQDYSAGLLLLARYHEPRSPEAALRYIDRQIEPRFMMRATFLREEGRLAALANQRERAIRAYRNYLLLRDGADAALQPEFEQVRKALAALTGER